MRASLRSVIMRGIYGFVWVIISNGSIIELPGAHASLIHSVGVTSPMRSQLPVPADPPTLCHWLGASV